MRPFSLTPEDIISIANPLKVEGHTNACVTGIASLEKARMGDLSFLADGVYATQSGNINISSNLRYEKDVLSSKASVLLLPESFEMKPKENQLLVWVKKTSPVLALICQRIDWLLSPKPIPGVHPSATIDREADIHPDVYIAPMCVIGPHAIIHKGVVIHSGCYIGPYAIIGFDTELKPRVTVSADCEIGARCILHSGVVIGSDGFGYHFEGGKFNKIPQIGRVVIEDDVEIGANTTVDRARFGETRIGQGTKIDNLVQIGHNAVIGRHCMIVAQCGIAGSAVLEDYVMMGGQSGVSGHVVIGTQTKIAAQSGVNCSHEANSTLSGTPAMDLNKNYRLEVLRRKLPELFKRIGAIEEKLADK